MVLFTHQITSVLILNRASPQSPSGFDACTLSCLVLKSNPTPFIVRGMVYMRSKLQTKIRRQLRPVMAENSLLNHFDHNKPNYSTTGVIITVCMLTRAN